MRGKWKEEGEEEKKPTSGRNFVYVGDFGGAAVGITRVFGRQVGREDIQHSFIPVT